MTEEENLEAFKATMLRQRLELDQVMAEGGQPSSFAELDSMTPEQRKIHMTGVWVELAKLGTEIDSILAARDRDLAAEIADLRERVTRLENQR